MRLCRDHPLLYSLILLPSLSSAVTFDCTHVRVDGHKYDFSVLGGPRTVTTNKNTPPTLQNTTYTIDLCHPIKKDPAIPKDDQCHAGARVCAITTTWNPADKIKQVQEVIDIAGEYSTTAGQNRALSPKPTRLKKTDSETDGIRLELNGGRHPWDGKGGRKQQAIIEFICDRDRTGLEGLEGKDEKERARRASDEEKESETPDKSLIFKSYGAVDDVDVLRLDWLTEHACEGSSDEKDDDKGDGSSGWGFFTWFIVIAFLGISAYLIFGSWLNYNRYGARGWDLLPHGDTIRDIPYLFRDWMRRVVNTVQGGGSRGGYSAV